jgi:hypothetical protein
VVLSQIPTAAGLVEYPGVASDPEIAAENCKPFNQLAVARKRCEVYFVVGRLEFQNFKGLFLGQNLFFATVLSKVTEKIIPTCDKATNSARFCVLWSADTIPALHR